MRARVCVCVLGGGGANMPSVCALYQEGGDPSHNFRHLCTYINLCVTFVIIYVEL